MIFLYGKSRHFSGAMQGEEPYRQLTITKRTHAPGWVLAGDERSMLNSHSGESERLSGAMQRNRIVSGRLRVAVAFVIFALLAFTTIHTSPISAGFGPSSSLSKTTPKQRQSTVQDLAWAPPVLAMLTVVPLDYGNVFPADFNDPSSDHFSGRYFSLPPPRA